jgi:hypothetical protein
VAGKSTLEKTMKKFPLLFATSVGALGIFMTADAFASQVSDHGGTVTATALNDDNQDATTGDQNDDSAVESDASNGDQGDESVAAADQQQGGDDQGENASDDSSDSGDHQSGDHTGGDSGGGGGDSGGDHGGDD